MVIVELAGQRLHQRIVLGDQPATGETGQCLRASLSTGQRLQHGASRGAEEVGGHRREFDLCVLQHLLDALPVTAAFADEDRAEPGQVAQFPDRSGRHEGRPEHTPLGELAQPHRVELVGLGTARDVLDVASVGQPALQAAGFEEVEPRLPVAARRLHDHPGNALAEQVIAQFQNGVRGRAHVPHPLGATSLDPFVRQTRAQHPGRLGHIDRGDSLYQFRCLLDRLGLVNPHPLPHTDPPGGSHPQGREGKTRI